MYYACINNNTVENVIVADANFVSNWEHNYQAVIPCDNKVGIGYKFSEENGIEIPQSEEIIDAEIVEPVKQISAPTDTKLVK